MKLDHHVRRPGAPALLALALGVLSAARPSVAQTPSPRPGSLPSETPAKFEAVTDSFDYVKRDVMIPMRDGVKLHTVVLVPKGAKGAPILLTRTPYNATELTSHAKSSHLGPILSGYDNATEVIVEGGYIRVVQDAREVRLRGRLRDEPAAARPAEPHAVDHATDTYDTIDWLVKNVSENRKAVQRIYHAPGQASLVELPLVVTP